jgi:DNA-damage-inducible protein J
MAQVNIRIDDNLKEQADRLFEKLGMNMSTAINVFIRQAVRQRRIPFTIATETDEHSRPGSAAPGYGETDPNDPFYSEANMKWIMQSIAHAKEGKYIVKTMEELERMANE